MNTRFGSFGLAAFCVLAALHAAAASATPETRRSTTGLVPLGPDDSGRTVISGVPWTPIQAGEKVIYGTDDRMDVYQESNPTIKAWAGSVCALLSTSELTASGGGWHIVTSAYRSNGLPPCAGEPFANQPTAAFCTGFLVGPDIVATAGHCFNANDYSSVRFVFGFEMTNATTPNIDVTADQVYTGTVLLGHQLNQSTGLDYSIIQLDRVVTAPGAVPLAIHRTGDVPVSTAVGVIGYPSGLPKKVAFGATTHVIDNTATGYFVANLDTYAGNSGSPVFNAATGVVEGILVRGNTDFNANGGCFVSSVMPDSTTAAEEVSKASTFAQFVPELDGKGALSLDHSVYSCTGTVGILLTDTNAAGTTQQVTVTSGAGDTETVTLTQTAANSHKFTGSIPLGSAPAAAQNGTLSIADGTTITVLYHDQNTGAGAQQDITVTAQADCAPPVVSALTFTTISPTSVSVQFQTNETASGVIAYSATACHDPAASIGTTASGTNHSTVLTGLAPNASYLASISSADAVGNSTVSDNGGSCYAFTPNIGADPVIDGGFELGNPNPVWTQDSTAYGSVICNGDCLKPGESYGPFAGTWWAWFGGVEGAAEDDYAEQSVTVPVAASAVLSFQLQIPIAHVPGYLRVLMDGTQLFQVTQADAAAYAAYTPVSVSVSGYADGTAHLLRFEGQGLLYTAPHNLTATGFVRVDNWQQVADYFAVVEG